MSNSDLIHKIKFAWEPGENNPNEGAFHLYDYWISKSGIKVIHEYKYLCGVKVNNMLHDLDDFESLTSTDSAIHKELCPNCQRMREEKSLN